MKRGAVAAIVTIGLVFGSIVTACDDEPTHVFFGQAYDPTRDCLATVTALDTIGGSDTGQSCALSCVTSPPEDGGVVAYVSKTCPPYPPLFDSSGSSPLCQAAIAAANRGATCLPDGGIVGNPVDAGSESDAGATDAAGD